MFHDIRTSRKDIIVIYDGIFFVLFVARFRTFSLDTVAQLIPSDTSIVREFQLFWRIHLLVPLDMTRFTANVLGFMKGLGIEITILILNGYMLYLRIMYFVFMNE